MTALWVDGCLGAVDGDHLYALRRAEECASLAIALGHPSGAAHATFVRGMARLFGGQVDEAVSDLQIAVRLERGLPAPNPILPTSLMLLGTAGCLVGRLDLARMHSPRRVCWRRHRARVGGVLDPTLRGSAHPR